MLHLEQLLAACPSSKRKLVITDSLFSMDGDFADLPGLVRLRQRYGFALAVDEAHATLVAGPRSATKAMLLLLLLRPCMLKHDLCFSCVACACLACLVLLVCLVLLLLALCCC